MDYPTPKNNGTEIFNIHNFFDPNKGIVASGDQRIDGDITQNSEFLYGDQTVGGMLYVSTEPLITGNLNTLTLTDNNLTSKKYVDDSTDFKITTALSNLITNPTTFYYGYGYSNNNTTPLLTNNYVQIGFVDNSLYVQTLIIDITYQITESRANTTLIFKNTEYTSQYMLSFYKFQNTFNGANYRLLSGSSLTGALSAFNGLVPVSFGVYQNKPCINFNFPNRNPNLTNQDYISNYGIAMIIKSSSPLNQNSSLSNTKQNAYFLLH